MQTTLGLNSSQSQKVKYDVLVNRGVDSPRVKDIIKKIEQKIDSGHSSVDHLRSSSTSNNLIAKREISIQATVKSRREAYENKLKSVSNKHISSKQKTTPDLSKNPRANLQTNASNLHNLSKQLTYDSTRQNPASNEVLRRDKGKEKETTPLKNKITFSSFV